MAEPFISGPVLLAFGAVIQIFNRQAQARSSAKEAERNRAFQQEQFAAQREEQRLQAQERRDRDWAMADKQRQTALDLQENQMVLANWPLRLFPSQILKSHRGDGPTPLRVLLSLPANGPSDLEGPVCQALQHFVSNHYNVNLGVRPLELLDGAWKDGQFQGAASIKALHERLRSEPTLVLETQMPQGDDFLYVNLAYWGPGQDQPLYQPLEKIAYRPLIDGAARAGAEQWRQARATLVAKGLAKDNADADQRLGGTRAANLLRLEQEEALTAAGIGLDQVELPPFKYVREDYRAVHQFLITWHCLTMGWIGDLYHFSYWDIPPLLPTLLPGLLHDDFPPDVARAFLDHYCRSYRAVAAECPAWAPELALQLARPLAALPDPAWAVGQVGQAIQDWLALRGLPAMTGSGDTLIEGFCAQISAAEGRGGPALLADPDFRAGLRETIKDLGRGDWLDRLQTAERTAEKLEQTEAARRAALLTPQDIHGWSADNVQALQRSVAEVLGLEPVFWLRLKDGSEGPEMVAIPPGSYLMGSAAGDRQAGKDERPQHRVTIVRPFAIGRYAVTFDEYDRFCVATCRRKPGDSGWGRGRRPVINVSWEDAAAYCAWLAEQTGRTYRLPTEAEWEYAARAGTVTRYWWGNEIGRGHANCSGCGSQWDDKQTAPVGSFESNPFGLHDTVGNVWEWVQDPWHDNYKGAPGDGSEWRQSQDIAPRVCRGGSWLNDSGWACASSRDEYDPATCKLDLGLRLAQDL